MKILFVAAEGATNWKLSGLRVSFDNATKLNIKKNNMTSLYGRNCAK